MIMLALMLPWVALWKMRRPWEMAICILIDLLAVLVFIIGVVVVIGPFVALAMHASVVLVAMLYLAEHRANEHVTTIAMAITNASERVAGLNPQDFTRKDGPSPFAEPRSERSSRAADTILGREDRGPSRAAEAKAAFESAGADFAKKISSIQWKMPEPIWIVGAAVVALIGLLLWLQSQGKLTNVAQVVTPAPAPMVAPVEPRASAPVAVTQFIEVAAVHGQKLSGLSRSKRYLITFGKAKLPFVFLSSSVGSFSLYDVNFDTKNIYVGDQISGCKTYATLKANSGAMFLVPCVEGSNLVIGEQMEEEGE